MWKVIDAEKLLLISASLVLVLAHSTYHTILQASPGKLVSGHDMILNTPFIADWGAIRRRKQQQIDKTIKTKIKTANRTFIKYVVKY